MPKEIFQAEGGEKYERTAQTDERISVGRRCCRRCGNYSDPCRNINPLLWGGYKVYRVKTRG